MIELNMLKMFCDNKELYEKYNPYMVELQTLERDLKILLGLIRDYYEKYDRDSIKEDELKAFYDYQYPSSREKESFIELITRLFLMEPNHELVQDLLEQLMEKSYATVLLNKLLPVIEGNKYNVLPQLKDDIDIFINKLRNPPAESQDLIPCSLSVAELVDQEIEYEGLRWHLDALNEAIGGVREKTLGLIYAYVDTGKTSFSVAAATNFCRQLTGTDRCVVYAGNEEAASRVSLRFTQSFLNCNKKTIAQDPKWAEEMRKEAGYDRIKIFDSITSPKQIIKLLEMYSPVVLFIDQGTKIEMHGSRGNSERDTKKLQNLFNFYRETAKRYNVAIVCVVQATGESENRKWLKLSDIYDSRVAIQAELDYSIGIGRNRDDASAELLRYFRISKNKMEDGDEARFHATFYKERCLWVPA